MLSCIITAILFSRLACIPTGDVPGGSHLHPYVYHWSFLNFNHSSGCVQVMNCTFHVYFPNVWWYLSFYAIVFHSHIFSGKLSIQNICRICVLLLSSKSSLYILDILSWRDMYFLHIFLPIWLAVAFSGSLLK